MLSKIIIYGSCQTAFNTYTFICIRFWNRHWNNIPMTIQKSSFTSLTKPKGVQYCKYLIFLVYFLNFRDRCSQQLCANRSWQSDHFLASPAATPLSITHTQFETISRAERSRQSSKQTLRAVTCRTQISCF